MYAYGEVTITVSPCWPASTTNRSGLVTLTFDLLTLKVVSESHVTWPTSVPILIFLGLSVLELRPIYATDRQTDMRQIDARRQTEASLNAGLLRAGHNNGQMITLLSQPFSTRLNFTVFRVACGSTTLGWSNFQYGGRGLTCMVA